MKNCVLLLSMILILQSQNLLAQSMPDSTGVITGKVVDNNYKGIDFITVSLYQERDTIIKKTTITDSLGNFSIELIPFGNYFIVLSRIGFMRYSSDIIEINLHHPKRNLDVIQLTTEQSMLKEVTITSQPKRLIQTIPGGYLFNANVDLIGKNGDALDMLKQVPGVGSDNNDNITLRGGAPTVLVNGKEIRLSGAGLINYLRSIQGSNIESIEVITSPTAKYPATGEAGILNIKLKNDNSRGVNGMLGLGVNTQNGGVQYGALNIKSSKLSFALSYNVNYGEGKSFVNSDITNKHVSDSNYKFLQGSTGRLYNNWQFANSSITYTPDSTLILGADLNFGRYATLNNTDLNSLTYTKENNFQEMFIQDSRQRSRNLYYMYDITFLKKMKKKGEEFSGYINAANYRNFNYLAFQRLFESRTPPQLLDQNNNSDLKYDFYTLKLDYNLPINENYKIEIGMKDDYTNVKIDFLSDTLDNTQAKRIVDNSISNNFRFEDNVLALYATLSGGKKKWDYQIGFRFENYLYRFHETSSVNKYSFSKSNLFPSLYLRYKIGTMEDISISLGKRVQRPGYVSLNPFINNSNYNYYSTGNPYLSPAFTYRTELQYSKYWNNYTQLLMVSLGYNYITDIIGQLLLDDGRFQKPYYTFVNYQNSNRYSLSITGQNKISKWWSINSDFNARYSDFKLTSNYNIDLSEPVFVFSGRLTNRFTFWKNSSLQISGQYLSAYNNFQNKIYPVGIVSIAFQKPLSPQWTLNASFEDVLYTQINKTVTNATSIYILTKNRTNSRYAVIRITYRFGKDFDKTRKVNVESNNRL